MKIQITNKQLWLNKVNIEIQSATDDVNDILSISPHIKSAHVDGLRERIKCLEHFKEVLASEGIGEVWVSDEELRGLL